MSTTPTAPAAEPTVRLLTLHRGQLVAVSIIGIILGLIGLFFPGGVAITVAILFGIYLVASGIFRINAALLAHNIGAGARWLTGLLGVLIVAAGIVCLAHPFSGLFIFAYVIGIGWIAEGLADLMAAVQGAGGSRWLAGLSGALSIVAGIVLFILPAYGILTFIFVGSILLLVVSVSTLLTIPRKLKQAEV